jgi:thiol-disulfide isomerase/thioredoxin
MKKVLLLTVVFVALSVNAVSWKGLGESNWYSGPKITEADLAGKVVMVDKWGVFCPPCRALLPKMQEVWQSFKGKNFVLIGGHCQGRRDSEVQALVKANKLTFPIYEGAGLAENEPSFQGIPFLYVVNHRGKVVYSGHNHNMAMQAAQEAILALALPPTLLGDVILDKRSPYKPLEKQLVLGKNISSVVKKLEKDVKNAEKRTAKQADKDNAEVAAKILAAIEEARREIPAEIELKKNSNPVEALDLLVNYAKTFPKDSVELKKQIPELRKSAAEWKKAEKAKGRK